MKTLLIGNGYWGKIVSSKLNVITDLQYVANSKTDLDFILLNTDLDFVFVCTPTDTHYDIVNKCLDYNKNVFCEKPFTGNIDLAIKLYEKALSIGKNIYIDNIFLYRTEFKDMVSFNNIEFIWNKMDLNYNENLFDSLLYHDIYMLIDKTNKHWQLASIDVNDTSLCLNLMNVGKTAMFKYNRNEKKKEKKIITDNSIIDFTNPVNNPLEEIITNIKNNMVDYDYNKKITLETLEIIQKIKKSNESLLYTSRILEKRIR